MSNDTAKTQTINIVPVQGIFEPLPPYAPVTLIGPAGTPFYAPINPNLDGVSITNSTINSSTIGLTVPAAGAFTNISTTTGTITAVPSGPTSIVNQAYVDSVAQGLSFKQPANFATTGNITLSGLGTQANGDWPSTLTAGDRILVKNQTAQENNGIYVAASGAWTRASDANTYDEFLSAYLFVISGTTLGGSAWVCTNQPGGTLGVTPIVFIQFSNTALYTAGTGLTLAGYQFSITNTGVTAASYGSASDTLTAVVNAQGQLTSLAASPIAIANTQVSGLGTMSTQNSTSVSITGGNIDGTTIGGTTAAAVTGTTVTANTQFSGPGTGLTGTASALSIGGNAATATSATTATNLAGGATGSLPYQSGAGATTFLAAGTNGQVLTLAGGVPTWAAEQYTGDVVGPASATDNAIARFDTTSGKLIQNSTITLSDAGALQNVNEINFDITPTGVVGGAGSLAWNTDDNAKTLDLVMEGGAIVQQIGEETFYRVRASSAITAGQTVMFTGTLGASGGLTAAPATGLTASTGQYLMGIAAENISLNSWGYVTHFGEVRGFNTSGSTAGETWINGDILYYNPSVAGGLTKTVPAAPNAKVEVCAVVYASNSNGIVFVRPTFYPSFNQLNDVSVPTPSNGDLVVYNSGNSRWQSAAQSTITAGKATNLAGGGAGQVPYQSAADTTAFVSAGTTGQVLTSNGTSAPTWTTPVAAITVTDDTTTNLTRYPLFADATSGTLLTTYVASTKYQFNPSTGVLTATSFSGAGTGLTGTASGLSIGGNAATATSATSATTTTNLAGGANGSLPYQTGSGATTFLGIGTTGQLLTVAGGVPTWAAAPQTGVTITDDTSTNATRYITFTDATSGTETGLDVSSTKLQFNPSTGTVTAPILSASTNFLGSVFKASGSAGGTLQNSGGTAQLQWGSGGGNNLSLEVPTNINPVNGAVQISPTGTGTVAISPAGALTINPTTSSTMNNVVIGGSTAAAATFTDVTLNAQGDLRFADSDSSNWVAFQAPATVASNVTWTLPSADGTNGQVLSTNGSGTLSWGSVSGGIAWQSVQTSNFTAVANQAYPVNTTSASITVTLPATPSAGQQLIFVDYAGTWDTNILVINTNSNKLNGTASATVNVSGTERGAINLVYIDSTQGWITYAGYTGTPSYQALVNFSADYLVVAGGGSGGGSGAGNMGGGGGAGGYRSFTSQTLSTLTNYTVTVGAGGAGTTAAGGNKGSDSVFSTITSTGGGYGGTAGGTNGQAGGSGGGGVYSSSVFGAGNTPTQSPSQGNDGANGSGAYVGTGGGGGGASATGSAGGSSVAGNGGAGTASSITGSSVTRAGGGGGGANNSGLGGTRGLGGAGGGGNGSDGVNGAAQNGSVNTGGGGGGASSSFTTGGSGGSGVVIVKYPNTYTISNPGGGLTFSTSTSGSDKITTFTAGTGTIQFA